MNTWFQHHFLQYYIDWNIGCVLTSIFAPMPLFRSTLRQSLSWHPILPPHLSWKVHLPCLIDGWCPWGCWWGWGRCRSHSRAPQPNLIRAGAPAPAFTQEIVLSGKSPRIQVNEVKSNHKKGENLFIIKQHFLKRLHFYFKWLKRYFKDLTSVVKQLIYSRHLGLAEESLTVVFGNSWQQGSFKWICICVFCEFGYLCICLFCVLYLDNR